MKKRWIVWGLMSAMLLTGCGAKNAELNAEEGVPKAVREDTGAADKASGTDRMSSESSGGSMDDSAYGDAAETMGGSMSSTASSEAGAVDSGREEYMSEDAEVSMDAVFDSAEGEAAEMPMEEPGVIEVPAEEVEVMIPPAAGLLTAGEWCDNENWGFFTNLITTRRFNFQVFGLMPYERVVVHAVSAGTAVRQTTVELLDSQGAVISAAVTNHEGIAYLYYNVTGEKAEPSYVAVQTEQGIVTADLAAAESTVVTGAAEAIENGQQGNESTEEWLDSWNGEQYVMNDGVSAIISYELTVEVPAYTAPVKQLDLMFVFDTTGSMGDELLYLQTEFQDIAARVADQSTRISVNFYRDEGDEYVVRSYPFMEDVNEISALINAESANGGGDYEEAVDLALLDAVSGHDWHEDSVKLLFMILDAPPHDTQVVRENLAIAVEEAARKGIRIIPIASSGVDAASEALLRNLAMLTGGTYTFLTDDSGIGGSHLEPTIGNYEVEALNDLIVRLILEYYQ